MAGYQLLKYGLVIICTKPALPVTDHFYYRTPMPVFRIAKPSVVLKGLLATCATALLVACGSSDAPPAPSQVALTNLVAPANANTVSAFLDTPFTFTNGVAGFGTTSTTTVTFSANAAKPSEPLFTIQTPDGGVAKGTTTFGSCIFTVASYTNQRGAAFLAVGDVIRIDPCTFNVATQSAVIGATSSRNVTLVAGSFVSGVRATQITLSPTGAVLLGGFQIGTVTFGNATGGTN
jgi:hypothetical protein